jgi:diguanylate cyclase (GGDEF)-like protein/PAS domain S-box-containing protein
VTIEPTSQPKRGNNTTTNQTEFSDLTQAVVQSVGMGIYLVQHGNFIYISTLYQKLTGYSEKDLIGTYCLAHVHPDDKEVVREKAIKRLKGESSEPYEYRFIKKNGDMMWILEMVTSAVYRGERATVGSFMDITKRKSMEQAMQESEERFRSVVQTATDAIVSVDSKGNITFWNHAAKNMFGYHFNEVLGKSITLIIPERFHGAHTNGLNRIASGGEPKIIGRTVEVIGLKKDNSEFPLELSLAMWKASERILFTAILRDISGRKRAEQELSYLATHDPLTRLPNRMLFADRLAVALAQAKRTRQTLAVMMLDLDYFKNINDKLGHDTGDQLLISVGERLTSILRQSDTVARMGGDEFMILLPHAVRVEYITIIAQKVLNAFQQLFTLGSHNLRVTASVGISTFPDDSEDADGLFKNADVAMYRAKEQGRNNYQFFSAK